MTETVTTMPDGSIQITYDPPESDPRYGECGLAVPISLNPTESGLAKAFEILHADAKKMLAAGTVYEIRTKVPSRFEIEPAVAWYHVDSMRDWPVTGAVRWPGKMNPLGGYRYLGTFRTP